MATYAGDGDPGCNAANWNKGINASNPATFNPTQLNPSQWMDSMDAMGVRNFVMTAKHGCGHLLWPTNVTLPGGAPYTFCVGKADSAIGEDVLGLVRTEAAKRGISVGFYYSMSNNYYMKVAHLKANPDSPTLPGQVAGLTQQDYESIALAQLTELWSNYGELSELWFDGTYPVELHNSIKKLIMSKQPNAVVWNGLGMFSATADDRISNNGVRWVGTESGLPNGEIWSTASQSGDFSGRGDPNSPIFAPAGCDFSIQNRGHWFFTPPGSAIMSLSDMVDRYHATVGRNGVIEVDFAINRDGVVQLEHAALYKAFGDWLRGCYGGAPSFADQALVNTSAVLQASSPSLVLRTAAPAVLGVDRLMVQEDQADGQRVRAFTTEAFVDGRWVPFSSGQSVGNKRIDLLPTPIKATAFRFNITAAAAWPVSITNFAAFKPCDV